MKLNILFLFSFIFLAQATLAQPLTKASKGTYVLTNATIVTVTNGTVEGDLLIQNGQIAAIGEVNAPSGAETIDCSGHFIYPGMIDGNTQLGLAEVSSVNLTVDHNETGSFNPQMQALTAVNPNAVAIPVTRVGGVTTVVAMPTSGLFPGTASLVNLVGYTPNQMYAGFKGLALNWPGGGRRGWWDSRTDAAIAKQNAEAMKNLNDIMDRAALMAKIMDSGQTPDYNPEIAAIVPVVKGEMPLMINVNRSTDITKAIKWAKDRKIEKVILIGVREGWRVAKEIADAGFPVVTGPILATPTRTSDRYDRAYANPGIMQKAGVKVAITSGETENVRNLPFNAGFAAAYGMGKEEALKAVTINPAEIFGVADQIGSLEVGKKANLFVSDGDPFETKSQIKYVFIDGWQVPMDSRHIRLYDEFLERSPGLRK
ncbi:MAG: amidohydrolase family protein [Bacteroidota bacterium]